MTELPNASFRCSLAAQQRADSLIATAAPATGWVLVEHPGPWPRRAFEDCPLGPGDGQAIVARARALGWRPLFIRRHGRRPTERRFAVIDADRQRISWQPYQELADVLAADWQPRERLTRPMFLTCAHGRHDQCCAIEGRVVARAFDAAYPEDSWECSHLGGDRFAANVLVVPNGSYYGYVEPADVARIATAALSRAVVLDKWRGQTTEPPPVQAARQRAFSTLGLNGLDQLNRFSITSTGANEWRVELSDDVLRVSVDVQQVRCPNARATCANPAEVAMHTHTAQLR